MRPDLVLVLKVYEFTSITSAFRGKSGSRFSILLGNCVGPEA